MADCCPGEGKYYVGDVGTVILVDACVTITTATKLELKVRKPDGTLVTWTGALSGTTQIQYITVTDDWDQAGVYRVQAYVELPGGVALHGDTASFRVRATYE